MHAVMKRLHVGLSFVSTHQAGFPCSRGECQLLENWEDIYRQYAGIDRKSDPTTTVAAVPRAH